MIIGKITELKSQQVESYALQIVKMVELLLVREQMIASEGLEWWRSCEQGFINQFGEFLTREEAWVIANANGQIMRESTIQGTLFSECLY